VRCRPYLARELELLRDLRVIVPLGRIAFDTVCDQFGLRPRPRFGHGAEIAVPGGPMIVCSFHVSQQNTFTGKLTEAMLDAVFARARALGRSDPSRHE